MCLAICMSLEKCLFRSSVSFFKISLLIFFFAVRGLHCCMDFSIVVACRDYSLVVVCVCLLLWSVVFRAHRLLRLQPMGSVVVGPGLSCSGACGISGSGIKPLSPALASGFLTTEPPGMPWSFVSFSGLVCFLILGCMSSLYI